MEKLINRIIEKQIEEVINLIEKIEENYKDYGNQLLDNIIDKLSDFLKNEYELLQLIYDKLGENNV